MARQENVVIAVDFDGTLCENAWPEIGAPKEHSIGFCLGVKAAGGKLILWTCREGKMLEDAVHWCAEHGLTFDAVNANLPERIEHYNTDPRKIGADFYVDDRNLLIKELM